MLDILLQLLDAARITVSIGQKLDFSGFYMWLTSNIGSRQRQKPCLCVACAGPALVENRLEDVADAHALRRGPARTQSAQAWLMGVATGQPACG